MVHRRSSTDSPFQWRTIPLASLDLATSVTGHSRKIAEKHYVRTAREDLRRTIETLAGIYGLLRQDRIRRHGIQPKAGKRGGTAQSKRGRSSRVRNPKKMPDSGANQNGFNLCPPRATLCGTMAERQGLVASSFIRTRYGATKAHSSSETSLRYGFRITSDISLAYKARLTQVNNTL